MTKTEFMLIGSGQCHVIILRARAVLTGGNVSGPRAHGKHMSKCEGLELETSIQEYPTNTFSEFICY